MNPPATTLSDIAPIITAFAAVISLTYIARQVRNTHKTSRAQFLLELHTKFQHYTEIYDVLEKIRTLNSTHSTQDPIAEISPLWIYVFDYMGIFERIQIMVEDDIIPLEQVDRLYLYRVQWLVENPAILARLQSEPDVWLDFIRLCKSLADRERRKLAPYRNDDFISTCDKLVLVDPIPQDDWRNA